MWALPSKNGWACLVSDARDAAPLCAQHLEKGVAWGASSGSCDEPNLRVFGLIADDVRRVNLVLASGERIPTLVGRNAFFVLVTNPNLTVQDIAGFRVTYRDGRNDLLKVRF